jgi:hypothetical protein
VSDESDLRTALQAALAEGIALREEIRLLKETIARHSIPVPEPIPPVRSACLPTPEEFSRTSAPATNEQKIALFRALFRGREDVYATRIRFKKDGTWGYVPDAADYRAHLLSDEACTGRSWRARSGTAATRCWPGTPTPWSPATTRTGISPLASRTSHETLIASTASARCLLRCRAA